MKQADVVVGQPYLTYIGESLARVVVTDKVVQQKRVYDLGRESYRAHTSFRVKRQGEDKPLPKLRNAAALRPLPGHTYSSAGTGCYTQEQEATLEGTATDGSTSISLDFFE